MYFHEVVEMWFDGNEMEATWKLMLNEKAAGRHMWPRNIAGEEGTRHRMAQ